MSDSEEVYFDKNLDEIEFTHIYEINNLGPSVLLEVDVRMYIPEVVSNSERWLGLFDVKVSKI